MPKRKKPTRCFTHADIVKFYEEHWGKEQDPVYTLKKIELLPEITPPTWHILYTSTYCLGNSTRETDHTLLVLQCMPYDDKPYLNIVHAEALPKGYSSVQEEDEEIECRRLEQEAAWWAKWEEERKQDNGNHDVSESL